MHCCQSHPTPPRAPFPALRALSRAGTHTHSAQSLVLTRAPAVQQHAALARPESEPAAAGSTSPTGPESPFTFNIRSLENARHSKSFWAVEPPLPITEPPRVAQLTRNSRFVPLCFDNGEACYRDISTKELVRSVGVFTVCGWGWLVKRADWLFAWSDKLMGWTGLPSLVVRHTFFAHFCAGEDQQARLLFVHCAQMLHVPGMLASARWPASPACKKYNSLACTNNNNM